MTYPRIKSVLQLLGFYLVSIQGIAIVAIWVSGQVPNILENSVILAILWAIFIGVVSYNIAVLFLVGYWGLKYPGLLHDPRAFSEANSYLIRNQNIFSYQSNLEFEKNPFDDKQKGP